MEKFKDFIKKYKAYFAYPILVCFMLAAFLGVGRLTVNEAAQQSKRQIINDDYSTLTEDITPRGIYQQIQVKAGTRLYGVNLLFHTYDRIQWGRVYVDLLDGDGRLVDSARREMQYLLNDTFRGFVFSKVPAKSKEDVSYTLHIYTRPQTEEDRIALWKSEGTYSGFEIEGENGTLALQYITDHVGGYLGRFYAKLAAVCSVGLFLVFSMTFFKKKRKLEDIVFVAVVFGGLAFRIFTPLSGAPDEYVHIATAYKLSNQMMGAKADSGFMMRQCDVDRHTGGIADYTPFRFKNMEENLWGKAEDTALVQVYYRTADVFKVMYIPRALGVSAARLMGFNYVTLVFFGRVANLLMYAFMAWFAVKMSPAAKGIFAVCAVLPMSLQLAGSFCYDAYVNGMAMVFAALVLKLALSEERITFKKLIPVAAALMLLAPAKTVYIMLGLMIFIIPHRLFKDRKTAIVSQMAVLCAAVIFWGALNRRPVIRALRPHDWSVTTVVHTDTGPEEETDTEPETDGYDIPEELHSEETVPTADTETDSPSEMSEGRTYPFDITKQEPTEEPLPVNPDPDILPNGDSRFFFSIPYMLTHVRQTVKMLLTTLFTQTDKYIASMLGTRLGEIIVVDLTASDVFLLALAAILLLAVLKKDEDSLDITPAAKLLTAFSCFAVIGLVVLACVMWTPANYRAAFGIQGRYFLPVLPLLLICLRGKGIRIEKNINRALVFATLAVDVCIILNIFAVICGL